MSINIGDRLPEQCMKILGIDSETRDNSAIITVTEDDSSFPHAALLSPYQIVAASDNLLYISIYPDSRFCQFLSSRKKGTLIVPFLPGIFYIKCVFEELSHRIKINGSERRTFKATPIAILEDVSDISPLTQELLFDESLVKTDYSMEFQKLKEIAVNLRAKD